MKKLSIVLITILIITIASSISYTDCAIYGNCPSPQEELIPGANYSINVNNSDYSNCWTTTEGIKCDVSDITYDEISGGDVNALGYTGTFNFLAGVVGQLSIDGDPWYLAGTDLEIADNLTVDGNSYLSDTYPRTTLTYSLGSGALRWLNLYVQNVNAEEIETYNIHVTENITLDGYINGINISNLSGTFVPYTGAVRDVNLSSHGIETNQLNVTNGTHGFFTSFYNAGASGVIAMLNGYSTVYDILGINGGINILMKQDFPYAMTWINDSNMNGTADNQILWGFSKDNEVAITGSVGENVNLSTDGSLFENTNNRVCTSENGICNQSLVETDPYWTGNQTNYYNSTDVDALIPDTYWTNNSNVLTSDIDNVNITGNLNIINNLTVSEHHIVYYEDGIVYHMTY